MMTNYTLLLDDQRATLEAVGGKGASLTRMVGAGLAIPPGFHITTAAYRQFVAFNQLEPDILAALERIEPDDPQALEAASQEIIQRFVQATIPADVTSEIVEAYTALSGTTPAVAVRSSATAEDLPEASFAGQQESYLNISGAEALLEATRKCWASLWTARAISYRARQGIAPENIALAVVVQILIDAEVSGILFTANPLNGQRDQMLLNASWGLGEAVVGGLVTPDTFTLEKSSGKVIKRQIADKLVQIVRMESGTREQSVPERLRRVPVISDEQAAELAHLGNRIDALYGMPMDIEWALAGGKFAILQARPITTLPGPELPFPIDWKLPKGAYVAMRNNIIELMADPLTPLFKTLGLGAVNAVWNRILTTFLGRTGIMPDDPIIAVNEYAYYNGSMKLIPMFGIILKARGIMQRMFTGAVERWTEEGRPRYMEIVNLWRAKNLDELTATELLGAARQLAEAAIEAYGALVSGVIPAAWMSEAWFTWTYKFLKRRDDPSAPTYLMGFDSLPIKAEKSLYDLAQWAQTFSGLTTYLKDTPTKVLVERLGEGRIPANVNAEDWNAWQRRFQIYLQDYGYMIYNLDFGNPVPADDPEPVLETFKLYLNNLGTNPHERQQATASRRQTAVQTMQARLKGRWLKSFRKNLERAQKYAPLREDGLAEVGLGYPLVRQMLLELGQRFAEGSMIEKPEEVFWLVEDEVEEASARLDGGEDLEGLSPSIPKRKAIWEAARRGTPPLALFRLSIFGMDLVTLKSGGPRRIKGNTFKGVGASPGNITAQACVVKGPEDFSKMKAGDILVAPLTTPAWTPLFARAAGVVTDVGGPLSHGSIVAREYGIPAVLGTEVATKRLHSGQLIKVDGSAGLVTLLEDDPTLSGN